MTGYFQELERTLSDATLREYGDASLSRGVPGYPPPAPTDDAGLGPAVSPRRRRLFKRWPPLALVAGVLLLSGTAAATIATLVDTKSAPLTGTVPPGPGIGAHNLHYDVPVTPDLKAGNSGWCSYPRFSISGAPSPLGGGGACAPAYDVGAPVILGGGLPISTGKGRFNRDAPVRPLPGKGQTSLFWMIVSSKVAAVRFSPGHVVSSRADPRLPARWRAVVAFVRGIVDPIPLDRSGHAIQNSLRITRPVPTRNYNPNNATPSPCSIHAPRLPGLTSQWQVVATTTPRQRFAVERHVLFSCARSWYAFNGRRQVLSAAVLLNAQDPRREAPPLPGLRPTSDPRIFRENGGHAGTIIARRIRRAWLVVQGQSASLRTTLLQSLRVQGSAAALRSSPGTPRSSLRLR